MKKLIIVKSSSSVMTKKNTLLLIKTRYGEISFLKVNYSIKQPQSCHCV